MPYDLDPLSSYLDSHSPAKLLEALDGAVHCVYHEYKLSRELHRENIHLFWCYVVLSELRNTVAEIGGEPLKELPWQTKTEGE